MKKKFFSIALMGLLLGSTLLTVATAEAHDNRSRKDRGWHSSSKHHHKAHRGWFNRGQKYHSHDNRGRQAFWNDRRYRGNDYRYQANSRYFWHRY